MATHSSVLAWRIPGPGRSPEAGPYPGGIPADPLWETRWASLSPHPFPHLQEEADDAYQRRFFLGIQ